MHRPLALSPDQRRRGLAKAVTLLAASLLAGHVAPAIDARFVAAARPLAQAAPRRGDVTPSKEQGPVAIEALVVDADGHGLPGVVVIATVAYARPTERADLLPQRAVSDRDGRIRVEVARDRVEGQLAGVTFWAHQPGRAIARDGFSYRGMGTPPVTRLVMVQPAPRTITVHGPDDRPIEGLRLAPHSIRPGNNRNAMPIPEELMGPLTVTTNAKGEATFPDFPAGMEPVAVRVAGPGMAAHTLALTEIPQKRPLRIGRAGRLVGIVRGEDGRPIPGVPVAVWVRSAGPLPSDMNDLNIAPEPIRFDGQPIATGPQGAFQTPSALLDGSTYRVSIRHEGFVPFISEWVTLAGERASLPPIRLRAFRKLAGQVRDRQGRPVGGARIFLPAGGPSTVTDAQGRFGLRDLLPEKTIVLVEKPGFRFQGWPVDPTTQADELRLALVRTSEAPDRTMTPLAEPISVDESRALANRLLEPSLQQALEQGNLIEKRRALEALSTFDLDRALELFRNFALPDERSAWSLRVELALQMVEKDPTEAESLLVPIADPSLRFTGLLDLAQALPASKREQKRHLLDEALLVVPRLPNSPSRIPRVAALAGAWLDLGDVEKARPLIQENLKLFDAGPLLRRNIVFLGQLARLEPEQALARIRKLTAPAARDECLAECATQLAIDHPAEAERCFQLREGRDLLSIAGTLRLCRRLARVDPERARRVAASVGGPGERVCAWAFVALGQSEKDRPGALEALDRAIEAIDRLRESGPGPNPGIILGEVRMIYPTNPAALILPVVERIAPERLGEVFWRAVALHPRIETDREDLLVNSYLGVECMLLARYDRDVAAVLSEPMDSYLRSLVSQKGGGAWSSSMILGKACVDPRAAVALLETLPAPPRSPFARSAYEARMALAEALGLPPEARWKYRWSQVGSRQLPLDD